MAEKYTENHIIACYEADANQLLKPTAMLDSHARLDAGSGWT